MSEASRYEVTHVAAAGAENQKPQLSEGVRADALELGGSLYRALRYVAEWRGKRVVIKFGGAAMAGGRIGTIVEDIVALQQAGVEPVLVHGGGPEISERLEMRGAEARFVDGLRVTDRETMQLVKSVLGGTANRRLVHMLRERTGNAAGVPGHEGTLWAEPHENRELGFVGVVDRVDTARIDELLHEGFIPVIAPLAQGPDGETYNVNADTAAAAIAAAIGAEKFLLLTDVPGVYRPVKRGQGSHDGGGQDELVLISELTARGAAVLVEEGVVSKGMIPKIEACLAATGAGVPRAHILGAEQEHGLLVELFTERGIGTMITGRKEMNGKNDSTSSDLPKTVSEVLRKSET